MTDHLLPKISIITATFNSQDTVSEAIKSVAYQKYVNVEHLLVDGQSTDSTVKVARSAANANLVVICEPDQGIYDAINKGIKRSSGQIIGLVHSDDFYPNEHVLEQVSAAFENQDVDAVFGDLLYVDSRDKSRVVRNWKSGEFSRKRLASGWMPPHPTLFVRRHVFDDIGLYDTSYQIAADYDFVLRLFSHKKFEDRVGYLPCVIYKMRTGGASNRSLKNIVKKTKEDYEIIRRNKVGGFQTLARKNISKIPQFFRRSN